MKCLKIGEFWGKGKYSKWILDIKELSNGWYLIKTENSKLEIDEICKKQNIITPENRKGSQLAIFLLCDVANGTHPVESLLKANLDIRPKSK